MTYIESYTRAAGVTFANDPADGGESRQAILKAFADRGIGVLGIRIVPCVVNGEKALKLKEKNTKKVLGYIPKKDIARCEKIQEMVGYIQMYKGIYSLALNPMEKPTAKQYNYVLSLARAYGIPMPVYDKNCYNQFLLTYARR